MTDITSGFICGSYLSEAHFYRAFQSDGLVYLQVFSSYEAQDVREHDLCLQQPCPSHLGTSRLSNVPERKNVSKIGTAINLRVLLELQGRMYKNTIVLRGD